ncbi:MAG: ATP-binding protein [Candidatus Marinimicrobia bacterium]|nr:ATP-binding protein [Candidatus Neomarinimicrobiota bacterium]
MFYKDILLIDDSEPFCKSIQEVQEDNNWSVVYNTNPESGLEFLEVKRFKVVLLDIRMPIMSGLEFLAELVKRGLIQRNYVIVLTGEITIENAVDSLRLGAKDFIQKHAVVEYPDLFLERIEKGFLWQQERIENEHLAEERKRAIEESRLIVKSVGHDMSGSYYASLMLRLQTLQKKIEGFKKAVENCFETIPDGVNIAKDRSPDECRKKMLELVDESIEKGRGIITLMGFFKELGEKLKHLGQAIDIDKSHKKTVDLNALVKEAIHLFTDSQLAENPDVELVEDYSESPINISASEEDLIRVFVNLVENAFKAMDGTGTLTTHVYRENGYAVVEISDTGVGIPEEKLDRIWRPDYTNWSGKQGTGLGLLICKKAVENHEGEIHVNSVVGKGTTFTIKFKLI